MEKYKKELYDQKNGFTRNEYLDKISRKLREFFVLCQACVFCCFILLVQYLQNLINVVAEPILGRLISRHQVDNKIRRIERRYKNRNEKQQKSGAGNLSPWGLEEHVTAVIGNRPTVHVETVSSLRRDNSKGQFQRPLFLGGERASLELCKKGTCVLCVVCFSNRSCSNNHC